MQAVSLTKLPLLKCKFAYMLSSGCLSIMGPSSVFSPATLTELPRFAHGLSISESEPAALRQMAFWIDKAVLLPSPCYITQTLSPLPTKIHLCSQTSLNIHHLDTCIETMTIMTARNGSQNNMAYV